MYLLQTIIDPTEAVHNISQDGTYAALFIITLTLLLGAIVFIRKTLQRQINELKVKVKDSEEKLRLSDDKYEKSRTEFIDYIKSQSAANINIIKENTNVIRAFSERIDSYRMISEKLLTKI
jgi:hypothetical protein